MPEHAEQGCPHSCRQCCTEMMCRRRPCHHFFLCWPDCSAAAWQVCIEGIVRASERPSMFVPANHPSEKEFFWIDVPALASACGLPEDTPLIEVGSAPLACLVVTSLTSKLLALQLNSPPSIAGTQPQAAPSQLRQASVIWANVTPMQVPASDYSAVGWSLRNVAPHGHQEPASLPCPQLCFHSSMRWSAGRASAGGGPWQQVRGGQGDHPQPDGRAGHAHAGARR